MVAFGLIAILPHPSRIMPLINRTSIICRLLSTLTLMVVPLAAGPFALAQPAEPESAETTAEDTAAPEKVEIEPLAEDDEISTRLKEILVATDWFTDPAVRVDQGVVFLSGATSTSEHRTWAGDLARKTQDVVAVVNRIEVTKRSMWDFSPAFAELSALSRDTIQALPNFAAALILLVVFWLLAKLFAAIARGASRSQDTNKLLRQVLSKAVMIPFLILGAYLALRITGLTRLAATVLGGTGLLGIVLGIAFRDIAENFLASLLISMQSSYRVGDTIIVGEHEGIVQSVTTRGTQLMTMDGNHVQIPNSTIYKSVIENVSANPNMRLEFAVGVDYNDSAAEAQNVIFDTLAAHEAVLKDPEPMILIEQLAASTVNLRIYFWINASENSNLKVRSSVMRMVKQALQQAGLTLPDEAREVIFPNGVPVLMQQGDQPLKESPKPVPNEQQPVRSEASLETEKDDLQRQADASRRMDEGENLL